MQALNCKLLGIRKVLPLAKLAAEALRLESSVERKTVPVVQQRPVVHVLVAVIESSR